MTTMNYTIVRLDVLKKAALILENGNLQVTKWHIEDARKNNDDEARDKSLEIQSCYCARDQDQRRDTSFHPLAAV